MANIQRHDIDPNLPKSRLSEQEIELLQSEIRSLRSEQMLTRDKIHSNLYQVTEHQTWDELRQVWVSYQPFEDGLLAEVSRLQDRIIDISEIITSKQLLLVALPDEREFKATGRSLAVMEREIAAKAKHPYHNEQQLQEILSETFDRNQLKVDWFKSSQDSTPNKDSGQNVIIASRFSMSNERFLFDLRISGPNELDIELVKKIVGRGAQKAMYVMTHNHTSGMQTNRWVLEPNDYRETLDWSAKAMTQSVGSPSQVFISYVKDDIEKVCQIADLLRSQEIEVWLDKDNIKPGERWQRAIRKAIETGAFFVACFSTGYFSRQKTYMNEELIIAIEQMRQMHDDRIWFVPVKLDLCEVPDKEIGRGETLRNLQWIDLNSDWENGIAQLIKVIKN